MSVIAAETAAAVAPAVAPAVVPAVVPAIASIAAATVAVVTSPVFITSACAVGTAVVGYKIASALTSESPQSLPQEQSSKDEKSQEEKRSKIGIPPPPSPGTTKNNATAVKETSKVDKDADKK